ncbi:2-aminobenzoate-CoA ligase [Streptacidiphilus pinicola]|uniref:2-aminobenzoate-CoA ligase n=1 Tax=Streptacidiphilus pinicola TaxID=2219663 RepID=A0A2X0J263_9ACTN|nr:AMP-binding protein [Streptacidiphilus pinicola]RAG81478.1 2-aminobenzoate-CoA ligase [Streptacidiphilus pinicola]
MHLLPSAHVDSFARDHLPPAPTWPELRFDLPELHYPDRLNCGAELLDATIARLGADRPCLRLEDGTVWSYDRLRAQTDRIARVLVEDLGVVPGHRVLLRGATTPWLVACWLAVMKVGAVAVTVLAAQRRTELATMIEIAEVGHALCDARALDELAAVDAPGLRTVAYGGSADDDLLALAAAKSDAPFPAVPTSADDVALIAFTSGTTGRPKGCMHFHRDVLAIADTFSAHVLRPSPDDVFTGTPPLGFTFGLGGLVIFPLRVGASALLLEQPSPTALPAVIERHRVSVLFTAPTAYRVLLDQAGDADLSSLRRCVSAGENLPAATWEAFHARTGLPLINGIGSTELLHIFVSAADAEARPGVTGFPVPGFRARVVDPATGAEVPDGTPGLLAVQGPTGCRYLDDPRQAVYVHDGWNLTGDTYVRDPDGRFRYQARADDMIISAGYNIAGPEVEEALLRHPEVREAAVIGVPDEKRGQVVKAFVVLAEGVPADEGTAKALQDFVKSTISAYKYPRQVEFRASLPRTPTGKLQRFRLRSEDL